MDAYLAQMGVKDASLRARLEHQLPGADALAVSAAANAHNQNQVRRINAVRPAAVGAGHRDRDEGGASLFVLCDVNGGLGGLEPLLAGLAMPTCAVDLPPDDVLWEHADTAELAKRCARAIRTQCPRGPCIVAGVGFGAIVAHEVALQLQHRTDCVSALALFEGEHATTLAELSEGAIAPPSPDILLVAWQLFPLLQRACADVALAAFAQRLLDIDSYDAQLDYIATFKPAEVGRTAHVNCWGWT